MAETAEQSEDQPISNVIFKVIVIGDAGVGKSAFIDRYVHRHFVRYQYNATLGVDFALKVIPWSEKTTVRLQLWDIAGQERFTSMTRVYYRGAAACVIMFDLTSQQTFSSTIKWKKDLDSKCTLPNGKPIPCILVGNKSDLQSRPVPKETIDKVCKDHQFLGWTEMSVKEDMNVYDTMDYLLKELMTGREIDSIDAPPESTADQGGYIDLSSQRKQNERRLCSCLN